jgi:hypothetical protein
MESSGAFAGISTYARQAQHRKRRRSMNNRILRCCTFLVLGFAAMQTAAYADGPDLEGVWIAVVTPITCDTHVVIPNAPSFRGLYMFGHDGSLTNEGAFPVSNFRSSGVGAWQHTQAQMYTSAFWFFRYNADGSFLSLRRVTSKITVGRDQWASIDMFQDISVKDGTAPAMGCNLVVASRPQ